MSQHKLFTAETSIRVYFFQPSSPWERGTNENSNGLIWEHFSKGTDLTKISIEGIKEVREFLKDRPCAVLDDQKGTEVIKPCCTKF